MQSSRAVCTGLLACALLTLGRSVPAMEPGTLPDADAVFAGPSIYQEYPAAPYSPGWGQGAAHYPPRSDYPRPGPEHTPYPLPEAPSGVLGCDLPGERYTGYEQRWNPDPASWESGAHANDRGIQRRVRSPHLTNDGRFNPWHPQADSGIVWREDRTMGQSVESGGFSADTRRPGNGRMWRGESTSAFANRPWGQPNRRSSDDGHQWRPDSRTRYREVRGNPETYARSWDSASALSRRGAYGPVNGSEDAYWWGMPPDETPGPGDRGSVYELGPRYIAY